MAFFKTTIQDVNKYKTEKNTKKLVKCLGKKNLTVSREALQALLELNPADSWKDMTSALIRGNHPELKEIVFEFIRRENYDLVQLIIGYIADEIKTLNDKEDTASLLKSHGDLGFHQWLSDLSLQFKESSLTVLRNLLEHESTMVRIRSAEILSAMNDGEFRSKWEKILDDKFGIEADYEFFVTGLNESVKDTEIPLLLISLRTVNVKFSETNSYNLGLTDEYLHICPSLGGSPGSWSGYWKIPLKEVVAVSKQKERVDGFRKAYREAQGVENYQLVIRCKSKMANPAALKGGKTKLLIFNIETGYEERADKLKEIIPILREAKLKKADIFQQFFSEEHIKWAK